MRKVSFSSLFQCLSLGAGIAFLGLTGGAHAALQGRDLDHNLANGYEALYDTVLNVTWLADANFAQTSGADSDGKMSWGDSKAWANGLTFYGVTGWRLPQFAPVNGVSVNYEFSTSGTTDNGFNITSPRNELAYMYYVNLGLTSGLEFNGAFPAGPMVKEAGLQPVPGVPGATIHNLNTSFYWTGVDYSNAQMAWGFWALPAIAGATGADYKYSVHYAWAVHDGDAFKVSAPMPSVDEPGTGWLLLAGLGVCAYIGRARQGAKSTQMFSG